MGLTDAAETKTRPPRSLSRLLVTFGIVVVPAGAVAQTATVRPEVLASFPHDAAAFTQGLLVFDAELYESTGRKGESTVRRVHRESGEVLQRVDLVDTEFGEGIALVEDERLVQLTWQDGIAHVYDRATLAEVASFDYDGEGWGLCFDGSKLLMTDGSSTLFFRDPSTFEVEGQVTVTLDGSPVVRLNELECVGELVYANVWQTDFILRIDPVTGTVLTRIDASGLLTAREAASADVLNGIAYDPSSDHFYLTGKLWPRLFEVRFPFDSGAAIATVEAGSGAASGGAGGGSTSPATAEPEIVPASSQSPSAAPTPGPTPPNSPGQPSTTTGVPAAEPATKVAPPRRQSGACAARTPSEGPTRLACAALFCALLLVRRLRTKAKPAGGLIGRTARQR